MKNAYNNDRYDIIIHIMFYTMLKPKRIHRCYSYMTYFIEKMRMEDKLSERAIAYYEKLKKFNELDIPKFVTDRESV